MTAAGDENIEFTHNSSSNSRIILPAKLAKIKKAEKFPSGKFKWNSNEEVFSFLINLDKHNEWFCKQVQKRPQNGSMFLYNRKNKKTKDYRKDDFLWKTRKNFNTTREDHTKLKVDGVECLYGLYAHSSLVPTFHRRCYWLLQNPDIVLVHYLNIVDDVTTPLRTLASFSSSMLDKNDIEEQLGSIYSGIPSECIPKNLALNTKPCSCVSSTSKEGVVLSSQVTLSISNANQISGTKEKEAKNETRIVVENGFGDYTLPSTTFTSTGEQHRIMSTAIVPYNGHNNLEKTKTVHPNRNVVSASELLYVPGHHSKTRKLLAIAPKDCNAVTVQSNNRPSSGAVAISRSRCVGVETSNVSKNPISETSNRNFAQQNMHVQLNTTRVPPALFSVGTSCTNIPDNSLYLPICGASKGCTSQGCSAINVAATSKGSPSPSTNNQSESRSSSSTTSVCTDEAMQTSLSSVVQQAESPTVTSAGNSNNQFPQKSSTALCINCPGSSSVRKDVAVFETQGKCRNTYERNLQELYSVSAVKVQVPSSSVGVINVNDRLTHSVCSGGGIQTPLQSHPLASPLPNRSSTQANNTFQGREANSFGTTRTLSSNQTQIQLPALNLVSPNAQQSLNFRSISGSHCSNASAAAVQQQFLGLTTSVQSGSKLVTSDNTCVTFSAGSRQNSQAIQMSSNGELLQSPLSSSHNELTNSPTSLHSSNVSQNVGCVSLQCHARSPSLPRLSPDSLSLDLGDLQGFDSFEVDILDSDINHVLSEYFPSPEGISAEQFPQPMSIENGDSSRNSLNLNEHMNLDNQPLSTTNEYTSSSHANSLASQHNTSGPNAFMNGQAHARAVISANEHASSSHANISASQQNTSGPDAFMNEQAHARAVISANEHTSSSHANTSASQHSTSGPNAFMNVQAHARAVISANEHTSSSHANTSASQHSTSGPNAFMNVQAHARAVISANEHTSSSHANTSASQHSTSGPNAFMNGQAHARAVISARLAAVSETSAADVQTNGQLIVAPAHLGTEKSLVHTNQMTLYSSAQGIHQPCWPVSTASPSNGKHLHNTSALNPVPPHDRPLLGPCPCNNCHSAMHSMQTVPAMETAGPQIQNQAVHSGNHMSDSLSNGVMNLLPNDIAMEMVDPEVTDVHQSARTTSFKVVPSDNRSLLNVDETFSVGSDSPRSSGAQVHVEFTTSDNSLSGVDQFLLQNDSLCDRASLPNDSQRDGQSLPNPRHSNSSSPRNSFSSTLTAQATQWQSSSVVPGSARITDYSPEWSYPEGGVKVLVTGEWNMNDASYTCLFDGCSVQASLIQCGVLRCFCPPHDPGLVTLQVACNGFIVSNACVFEYRAKDSPEGQGSFHEWLAMDEVRFKLAILDRLERLESRLNPIQNTAGSGFSNMSFGQQSESFEERLVSACNSMSNCPVADTSNETETLYRGMSLLHLAAALGYAKLIQSLLLWHKQTASEVIQRELDPQHKDKFSCTPLMWACALGHRNAVLTLLECDCSVLVVPDARGRLPLQIARDRGYLDVVDAIEEFVSASPCKPDNALESDNGQASRSPVGSFTGTYISSPKSSSLSEDIPESPFQMPLTDFPENSAETRFADWRTSAVPLQDQSPISVNGRQLNSLGKALNHVKALIREAEQEADTENSGQTLSPTPMVTGQLSPMQEDPSLMTCSPPTWGPAGRFHTLSSSSSHSSPHTPGSSKSSLSPGSPGFLNSPHSSSGGPTDTKEFHEFLCSSRKWLEKDFSELTLTDLEQRELYEAAKIIQNAYRSYKIRCQQQDQELQAAILIQNHYRRYKQFALIKKMTKAAKIIQNQYRAYREHEQFKRSRQAAAIIQSYFRNYRQRRQCRREDYASKRQEARFLRQSSNRSAKF